jgi:hypothetical protein
MRSRTVGPIKMNRGQWSGLRRSRLGNVYAANGLRSVRAGFQLVRQFPNDFGKLLLERRDRHMVHSRSPLVLRNLLQPSRQIPFREHFVKQPKPSSSFHSAAGGGKARRLSRTGHPTARLPAATIRPCRFESRQHAGGPDARFDPAPTREDLTLGRGRSSLLSQRRAPTLGWSTGLCSVRPVTRHPSSWNPLLPRSYPASALLWFL